MTVVAGKDLRPLLRNDRLGDLLPVAVYVSDVAGSVHYYNRRAAQLCGRKPGDTEESAGDALRLQFRDAAGAAAGEKSLRELLHSAVPMETLGAVIQDPDGSELRVNITIDSICDDGGNAIGKVAVVQDSPAGSTVRPAGPAANTETPAMPAVGSKLIHDLRNPLAPIRNALELLHLAGNDPALVDEAVQIMERQVQQLLSVIDRIDPKLR